MNEIKNWLESDGTFISGIELFKKYINNTDVLSKLEGNETIYKKMLLKNELSSFIQHVPKIKNKEDNTKKIVHHIPRVTSLSMYIRINTLRTYISKAKNKTKNTEYHANKITLWRSEIESLKAKIKMLEIQ